MANIKVSELAEATEFNDYDYTMIVQSNQNKKIKKQNMFENDIFSLQETKTNKIWIDGKPIYRKTYNFGAMPNGVIKSIPLEITNLDFVIRMWGTSYSSETGNTFPLPYPADTIQTQVKMWVNENINLQAINDRSSYTKTYITIEYTKTTD